MLASHATPTSVHAQTPRSACGGARTTLEGRQCRTAALAKLEVATTKFEDSLYKKLDSTAAKALHRADTAWIEYRNLECAAAAGMESPGSMVPVLDLQCRIDRTTERLRSLRATYQAWLKP